MKRTISFLLIAAMTAGFAPSSQADESNPLQEKIGYSDLNVSQTEGAAALYRRLQFAAVHVCAPLEGRELSQFSRHRACIDKAVSEAVAKVGAPALTRYHQAKFGHAGAPSVVLARNP
jgi:UrcA family protein